MKCILIKSLEKLQEIASDGADLIINRNGQKTELFIQYIPEGKRKYHVWNIKTNKTHNITEEEIKQSEIGNALKKGNLYKLSSILRP